MKIHFVAAISQENLYGEFYSRVVNVLVQKGHQVNAGHILKQDLGKIMREEDTDKVRHYKQVLKSISGCDVVVAEASFPSTVHVGHEISLALEKGKPVVVLYLKGKAPVFLQGITSERVFVQEYTDDDLERVVVDMVGYASEQTDTRFNFFISPKIGAYMAWVSHKNKVPMAVFLRELIEKDMVKRGYKVTGQN